MRLSRLDKSLIGKKLASAIKTKEGNKLLNSGVTITDKIMDKLEQLGIDVVYVEDENTDAQLEETLNEDEREYIIKRLNEIYQRMAKRKEFTEQEVNDLFRKDILANVGTEPVSLPLERTANGHDIARHSLNVCLLTLATARNLGLNGIKAEILGKAALLHDIGKILATDKREDHEITAYEFLKGKTGSVILYNLVRFHHETIDGQGPQKLPLKHQNDLIKILSLCNHYENLISQENLLPNEAFERVQALVNVKFDGDVFDAFRKSVYIYPVGLPVKLSNGEEGIVIRQNRNFPLRPFIRTDKSEYNLLEHLTQFIEKIAL